MLEEIAYRIGTLFAILAKRLESFLELLRFRETQNAPVMFEELGRANLTENVRDHLDLMSIPGKSGNPPRLPYCYGQRKQGDD